MSAKKILLWLLVGIAFLYLLAMLLPFISYVIFIVNRC